MPKLKGSKVRKPRVDPNLESTYETEIEFMCPVRGLVKQKVKVKRMKRADTEHRQSVLSSSSILDVEAKDDGLSIYDGEDA